MSASNPHKSYGRQSLARSRKVTDMYRRATALLKRASSAKTAAESKRLRLQAQALMKRGYQSGAHTEGPVGRLPNGRFVARKKNSFFGAEATAKARRVKTIMRPGSRRVVERDTGVRGEIVDVKPGGFIKVKWDDRERPTLIKRSEIKRQARNPLRPSLTVLQERAVESLLAIRPKGRRGSGQRQAMQKKAVLKRYSQAAAKFGYTATQIARQWQDIKDMADLEAQVNPGLIDLAGSLQAFDYLAAAAGPTRKRKNPRGNINNDYLDGLIVKSAHDGRIISLSDWTRALELADKGYLRARLQGGVGSTDFAYTLTAKGKKAIAAQRRANKKRDVSRRNPSVAEMSKRFQGETSGTVEEYYASDYAPRLNFSRGGKLVFLKLKGKNVRVPGAVVAIDPNTEKLWIAGSDKRGLFIRKASRKGELLDYGAVDAICYLTAKSHIGGGKRYEYVHNFGEEGGAKPKLMIDHDGMPILKGGSYKIEARGIVN